ncbi:MAG: adenylosuccinate synthetase, partial [Bacteroidales bacterium]
TTAGVCSGLGVAPSNIGKVYGVFKAYCTRVGSGPFPTELFDAEGDKLRKEGREFGSTTGRPRRCGWLDLPALYYAIMLDGVTDLIVTKSDVLNTFERIRLCDGYVLGDKKMNVFPSTDEMENIDLSYIDMPGWETSLEGLTSYESLPQALRTYLEFIENKTKKKISIVSTGPDRSQTILR